MKVTIGNLFAWSVQLNLIPTKQNNKNEHDNKIIFLRKRSPVTVPREGSRSFFLWEWATHLIVARMPESEGRNGEINENFEYYFSRTDFLLICRWKTSRDLVNLTVNHQSFI